MKNPKVRNSSLLQKRNFLASKGLIDEEIQLAFERVGIFDKISDMTMNDDTKINIPQFQIQPTTYRHQMTTFEKIKDVLSSVALISGIAYAAYMFYKVNIHILIFFSTFALVN